MENGDFFRDFRQYKFPWAMTLGAIQDNSLIYEMTSKIAEDCKKNGHLLGFRTCSRCKTPILQILLLAIEVSDQTLIM